MDVDYQLPAYFQSYGEEILVREADTLCVNFLSHSFNLSIYRTCGANESHWVLIPLAVERQKQRSDDLPEKGLSSSIFVW